MFAAKLSVIFGKWRRDELDGRKSFDSTTGWTEFIALNLESFAGSSQVATALMVLNRIEVLPDPHDGLISC